MRPSIVRALTAALATAGTAGAIALPMLSLGEPPKSPSHAFALPEPPGKVVIESERLRDQAAASPALAEQPSSAKPFRAPAVIVVPTLTRSAPAVSPRPVAPAPEPVPVAAPKPPPAPTATPTPRPEPAPQPPSGPQPASEPSGRVFASISVQDEPVQITTEPEAPSTKHKQHKAKRPKEKPKETPKPEKPKPGTPEQRDEPPLGPPDVFPPADPVETVAAVDSEQEQGKKDDAKEHGSHGKAHDKTK